MATQKQVNDFINMTAPIAIDICNATSKKVLPSVCIAQACCESAYGTSPKMIRANAVLGVKVGKNKVHFGNAWKDKAYSTKTKECYDGKTYVEITDMFRAYDSVRDSIQDYYDMLGACSRYAGCINEKDYVKSITAIKKGGYATSPSYINTITSIIKKYNLTQYDTCMTGTVNVSNYPVLKRGSKGVYVSELQTLLTEYGYGLKIDGKFGSETLETVKAYQADRGLVVDGKVGPKTWAELFN